MYNENLKFHYRPEKGWINDPNGLVYFDGYYHVFYQHAPNFEVPWKEPMHWGHARTKDFITWEELPVALYPEEWYETDGCWSGTAIVKDNVLYLFYASVYIKEGDEKNTQTVSVAYSTDGINFKKYEKNPIIATYPKDGSRDFRDPALTCIDGSYYCVMASGNPELDTANLLLYKSENLLDWEYKGVMIEWENGKYAECPSFMPFGDKFLLTASVCKHDYHYFSIMVGDFKNDKFTITESKSVDKGPDQYAGQAFLDHQGRSILISWLPGWEYSGLASKDIGCMSLPKQILYKDGKITAYPIKEVQHFLKDSDPALKITDDGFIIERKNREPVVYHGEIKNIKCARDEYIIEVFVNDGEEIYSALL